MLAPDIVIYVEMYRHTSTNLIDSIHQLIYIYVIMFVCYIFIYKEKEVHSLIQNICLYINTLQIDFLRVVLFCFDLFVCLVGVFCMRNLFFLCKKINNTC